MNCFPKRRTCALIVAMLSFAVVGCSGGNGGVGPPMTEEEAILKEFNELIHCGTSKVSKLSELQRYEQQFPRAYQAAKSGDIVVIWNTPPMGEGDMAKGGGTVLAYEKNTPTAGGWVLFTDGNVKKMTSTDFNSTAKLKK